MTGDDRANDIHLRILAEKADDSLARHAAWQDARERHGPQMAKARALGSAYAALCRRLGKAPRP